MSTLTVLNGNDSGPGSLRDRMTIANANPAITTINFDISVTTVTLTSTSLSATRIGPGYTITGLNANNTNVIIDGSGMVSGVIISVGSFNVGESLNLDNITVTGGKFGAIEANTSRLNLTKVVVINNTNNSGGAGINLINTPANIDQSVIKNNVQGPSNGYGGGINAPGPGSVLNITNTTIDGNSAVNGAGGILIGDSFTITNSTISRNVLTGPSATGAGVYIQGIDFINSGFFNSTISGNVINNGSTLAQGGGIYINFAPLTISSTTIANNSTGTNPTGTGGGLYINTAQVILTNTIVAQNNTTTNNSDIFGNVAGSSYNLIGNGDSTGLVNGVNGNIVGTSISPINPNLNPLANYGGTTETMSLQIGSVAIDSGSVLLIPVGTLYDQRGSPYLRVSGPNVDIGAFELQQEPVCYRDISMVFVRNILTGNTQYIQVKHVSSDIHQVYDVNSNQFIDVKANVITGKVSEFYLLKQNCFGKNSPNVDFYVTGGHKINIAGANIKVRDIPQAKQIRLTQQYVYSICTEYQCPILINGLHVLSWSYENFLHYCNKRTIDFQNNMMH